MTEITVQLAPATDPPQQLVELDPHPLFPGSTDEAQRSWYYLLLPEDRDATDVVRELVELPEVSAAYVKPPESTP